MCRDISDLFSRPLALASAALVIHIGAATAADSTDDIQQRMRDLLAGTVIAHSAPSQSGPRDDKVMTTRTADSTGDIQQQMRDLLAGSTAAHSARQSGAREGARRPTASRVRTNQAPE
jgi:hypothetical protein